MLEFEKRQWIAELKIRTAREKRLEAEERCKEAKLCELLVCDRIKSTLSDSCLQYVFDRSHLARVRSRMGHPLEHHLHLR